MNGIENIWFIGGHSGGHFYPLLTISKNIKIQKQNSRHSFFLPCIPLILNIKNEKISEKIEFFLWNYPKPIKNIKILFFLFYSFLNTVRVLYYVIKQKPTKIYSTGGYFSFPFAFLAFIFRISFHLYHLDAIPGKASRLITYGNATEYYIFEETKSYIRSHNKSELVSYPIRYSKDDIISKEEVKIKLNIALDKKVIFILGGSQGSEQINNWIISILKKLDNKNIFIIHQTGKSGINYIKAEYKKYNIPFIIFDYQDDLKYYYNASDLIICRCGAGTLAEVAYFQKPALLIPLMEAANNHQIKNAELYIINNKNAFIINDKMELYIKINIYLK